MAIRVMLAVATGGSFQHKSWAYDWTGLLCAAKGHAEHVAQMVKAERLTIYYEAWLSLG